MRLLVSAACILATASSFSPRIVTAACGENCDRQYRSDIDDCRLNSGEDLAHADDLAACIQKARDDYRSCLDDCVSLAISTTPLHNFGSETLRLLSISSGIFVHNRQNYSCCRQRHYPAMLVRRSRLAE